MPIYIPQGWMLNIDRMMNGLHAINDIMRLYDPNEQAQLYVTYFANAMASQDVKAFEENAATLFNMMRQQWHEARSGNAAIVTDEDIRKSMENKQ